MRIGIIGSGNVGGALTHCLRALGHDVAVANSRGAASLASLANETGARAVAVEDVAKGRDFVVVAIPLCRIPELRYDVLADLPVVIDTSNYYPRQCDGLIAEIEGGVPESRWVEQHLRRPVIKAFNPILAIICATRVCQQALLAGSRWRSQATNLRRKRWPWA